MVSRDYKKKNLSYPKESFPSETVPLGIYNRKVIVDLIETLYETVTSQVQTLNKFGTVTNSVLLVSIKLV